MRLFPQPPAQSLSAWLDVATRDLVPSAQARIRVEIEGHYNEAVQSALANGSPESVAQSSALADLGNPQAAAKRFSKTYLTTKESQKVAQWILSAKRGGCWMQVYVCFYIMAPVDFAGLFNLNPMNLRYRLNLAMTFLVIPLGIVASLIIYFLAKRNITIKTMRQIILLTSLLWLGGGPLFLWQYIAMWPSGRHVPADTVFVILFPVASALVFASGVYVSFGLLNLRKKLPLASEADIPPPDTRARWPVGPWKQ
jgi:hypothetical protein